MARCTSRDSLLGVTFYSFVDSADDVSKSTSFTLLHPRDNHRLERFERVLRWYGRPGLAAPPRSGNHGIVLVDAEYAAAANFASRWLERPIVAAPGSKSSKPIDDLDSLLFVGRPESFGPAQLDRLRASVQCRWGVLTGRDVAGAIFLAAKSWLAERTVRRDGILVLDSFTDPETPRKAMALVEESFDLLVTMAHGEVGHVNLDSIVLCAISQRSERGPDQRTIDGCRFVKTRVHCKRVESRKHQTDRPRTLSFAEVRARHTAMVVCNGFVPDGSMYPSEVNHVLAATEGFAASLLAPDRPVPIDAASVQLVHALAAADGDLIRAGEVLNEAARGTEKPYVLLGDPAFRGRPLHRVPSCETRAKAPIIQVSAGPGTTVARVGARVFVVGSDETAAVDDATDRAEATSRTLDLLLSRVGRALHFGDSVSAWFEDALKGTEAAKLLGKQAMRLTRIRRIAADLRRDVAVAESVGLWAAPLDQRLSILGRLVGEWDRAAATIACSIPRNGLENISFSLQETSNAPVPTGESCPRCALGLRAFVGRTIASDVPRTRIECPVCGFFDLHDDDGARLTITMPPRGAPGDRFSIRIGVVTPKVPPPVLAGTIAYELKDKASGRPIARAVSEACAELEIEVALPLTLTADLHTLQVVHARGLDVCLARRRFVGERFLSERGSPS